MDTSPFDNSLPPHAKVTDFVIEEVFRVKREFSVTKSRFRFLKRSVELYLHCFKSVYFHLRFKLFKHFSSSRTERTARYLVDTKCYVC